MNIFIIAQTITFLIFASNGPTTLHFDEPIEWASIGRVGEFQHTLSGDRKNLELTPLKSFPEEWKPFVIRTKTSVFTFKIKLKPNDYLMAAFIHEGAVDKAFRLIRRAETYEIYEGDHSIRVVNLSSTDLIVNDTKVVKVGYFSKAPFLLINNETIKF